MLCSDVCLTTRRPAMHKEETEIVTQKVPSDNHTASRKPQRKPATSLSPPVRFTMVYGTLGRQCLNLAGSSHPHL